MPMSLPPRFIATSVGFINLDHVVLMRIGVEREEGHDLLTLADGRIVQCVIHGDALAPTAPAAELPEPPKTEV